MYLYLQVKALYDQYRVLSFSGEPGTGIAMDGVVEIVRNKNQFLPGY